jgi:transcriptional regulator with XRE-family HTH domain
MPAPEEVAGQELRHLRMARGWSQEHVAEQMKAYGYDWHQTLIGRIEAAQRPLRLNEAVHLAALFGVSLEMLLTRTQRELDAEKLRERIAELREQQRRGEAALYVSQRDLEQAAAHEHDIRRTVETKRSEVAKARLGLDALHRALAELEGRRAERLS